MKLKRNLVLGLLRRIPRGRITTYEEIGRVAKTHPRIVGMIIKHNKNPKKYPCYKIVMSSGFVGNYSRGIKKKIELLEKDKIEVKNEKIDLKKYFFTFGK